MSNNNNKNQTKRAKTAKARQARQKGTNLNNKRAQQPKRKGMKKDGPNAPVVGFFAPVAEGTIMKSVKPSFYRVSADEQRIVHREKVAKYTTPGTGVFTVLASLALNPGIGITFPWLSNEAAGWESYRFNRLRFIWVPTSGTAVAGNIIMAPDYDASDAAPAGETFMSSYTDCEEANVWARFCAEMTPDLLNGETRRKFVRLGALPDNADVKLYDSGNFFVASADDAVANSGKLWVEYDVSLYNPQVPPGGFQGTGVLVGATGLAAATPLGSAAVATGPVGLSVSTATVTITGVQVGQQLAINCAIQGTVITGIVLLTPVGMTIVGQNSGLINAAANQGAASAIYTVTAPNPTFIVSVTATTVTGSNVRVAILAPVSSAVF